MGFRRPFFVGFLAPPRVEPSPPITPRAAIAESVQRRRFASRREPPVFPSGKNRGFGEVEKKVVRVRERGRLRYAPTRKPILPFHSPLKYERNKTGVWSLSPPRKGARRFLFGVQVGVRGFRKASFSNSRA